MPAKGNKKRQLVSKGQKPKDVAERVAESLKASNSNSNFNSNSGAAATYRTSEAINALLSLSMDRAQWDQLTGPISPTSLGVESRPIMISHLSGNHAGIWLSICLFPNHVTLTCRSWPSWHDLIAGGSRPSVLPGPWQACALRRQRNHKAK